MKEANVIRNLDAIRLRMKRLNCGRSTFSDEVDYKMRINLADSFMHNYKFFDKNSKAEFVYRSMFNPFRALYEFNEKSSRIKRLWDEKKVVAELKNFSDNDEVTGEISHGLHYIVNSLNVGPRFQKLFRDLAIQTSPVALGYHDTNKQSWTEKHDETIYLRSRNLAAYGSLDHNLDRFVQGDLKPIFA